MSASPVRDHVAQLGIDIFVHDDQPLELLGEIFPRTAKQDAKVVFDPGAIGNEARSYVHRLPGFLEDDSTVDDGFALPRHGPKPRYTRRLSCYVTQDIYEHLDVLCALAGNIGRAGMVRLAVDKYLFDEIVGQFKGGGLVKAL